MTAETRYHEQPCSLSLGASYPCQNGWHYECSMRATASECGCTHEHCHQSDVCSDCGVPQLRSGICYLPIRDADMNIVARGQALCFACADRKPRPCVVNCHEGFGQLLPPCEVHPQTRLTCSPLHGHICLDCRPFMRGRCGNCSGSRVECCC